MVDRCVVRQVGERPEIQPGSVRIACHVGVEHLAPVRAAVAAADAVRVARLLAVQVGADHVNGVRHPRRRVDLLVVPALPGAEGVRGEVRVARQLRRQALPAGVRGREHVRRRVRRRAGALGREQRRCRLVGVVQAPEVRRKRARDAAADARTLGEIDARVPVLHGQRDHVAVNARVDEGADPELRREHLLERGLRRSRVAPPHAGIKASDIDDARVERVEADVGDAERQARVGLGAIPDLGEGRSAVCGLVEARLVRTGLEAGRAAVADHVREAAHRQRRADEEVLRVGRIDDDLVDPAP